MNADIGALVDHFTVVCALGPLGVGELVRVDSDHRVAIDEVIAAFGANHPGIGRRLRQDLSRGERGTSEENR
jgi:hypothetical protein